MKQATDAANASREASGKALTDLGEQKLYVLDHNMNRFISAFEKLHHIDLSDSVGMDELQKFKIDEQSMGELKEMSSMATSLLGGMASGVALGAITAFGAYGGAMTLGAASTGTAIASLSGVAATNATLAFLGGGALAIAGAMKAVMDTPILTDDGKLTPESKKVVMPTQKIIEQYA